MMLLSYTIVDFHLFYDGAVDIQIWAPPTRSQCQVCDTQVTVKACGPLVWYLEVCIFACFLFSSWCVTLVMFSRRYSRFSCWIYYQNFFIDFIMWRYRSFALPLRFWVLRTAVYFFDTNFFIKESKWPLHSVPLSHWITFGVPNSRISFFSALDTDKLLLFCNGRHIRYLEKTSMIDNIYSYFWPSYSTWSPLMEMRPICHLIPTSFAIIDFNGALLKN